MPLKPMIILTGIFAMLSPLHEVAVNSYVVLPAEPMARKISRGKGKKLKPWEY